MNTSFDSRAQAIHPPDGSEGHVSSLSFREKELRSYWAAAFASRHARDPDVRAEAADEIIITALHTDWPQLRLRCESMIG